MSKHSKRALRAGPKAAHDTDFIGAWDRDFGIDTTYEALYLIRGHEQELAEVVHKQP